MAYCWWFFRIADGRSLRPFHKGRAAGPSARSATRSPGEYVAPAGRRPSALCPCCAGASWRDVSGSLDWKGRSSAVASPLPRLLHAWLFRMGIYKRHYQLNQCNCNWILAQLDPERFVDTLMFSDESNFSSDGRVNRHNMHYWAIENPHWVRDVQHQGRWSVNVWCGVLGDNVVSPFFFDGKLFHRFGRKNFSTLLECFISFWTLEHFFKNKIAVPKNKAILLQFHIVNEMISENYLMSRNTDKKKRKPSRLSLFIGNRIAQTGMNYIVNSLNW